MAEQDIWFSQERAFPIPEPPGSKDQPVFGSLAIEIDRCKAKMLPWDPSKVCTLLKEQEGSCAVSNTVMHFVTCAFGAELFHPQPFFSPGEQAPQCT